MFRTLWTLMFYHNLYWNCAIHKIPRISNYCCSLDTFLLFWILFWEKSLLYSKLTLTLLNKTVKRDVQTAQAWNNVINIKIDQYAVFMKAVLKIFIRISSVRINLCLFYCFSEKSAIEFKLSTKTLKQLVLKLENMIWIKIQKDKSFIGISIHVCEFN